MRVITIALLCFLSLFSTSQSHIKTLNLKFGKEYQAPRNSPNLGFFGSEKDVYANLSLINDSLITKIFDTKTLSLVSQHSVSIGDRGKYFNEEKIVDLNGNYFLLCSDWNKSTQRELLYCYPINLKAPQPVQNREQILESDKVVSHIPTGGTVNSKRVGKYKYKYDGEKKHLLVTYLVPRTETDNRKSRDKFGIFVFDENMKKSWGQEFTMPYTEAQMYCHDFTVDKDGNAYLLARVFASEKRIALDKNDQPTYHLEILKFTKNTPEPIISKINIEKHVIKEVTLNENEAHELIISGVYSKKEKEFGRSGAFYARLANNEIIATGYHDFPLEDWLKGEPNRVIKKITKDDDYEPLYLQLRKSIAEKDGSSLLVLEEFKYLGSHRPGESYRGPDIFTNENIMAIKIDGKGKLQWFRKIPKKQMGAAVVGRMQFNLISNSTDYYFLFMDNENNIDPQSGNETQFYNNDSQGHLVAIKITHAGIMTREILANPKEEGFDIFPYNFSEVNNGQLIGPVWSGVNDNKVLHITIK